MSKFSVGDTVRVTDPNSPLFDQAFKVCGTWRGSREWVYNFTVRGETHTLSEHHLTLADPDVHTVLDEMLAESDLAPHLTQFEKNNRTIQDAINETHSANQRLAMGGYVNPAKRSVGMDEREIDWEGTKVTGARIMQNPDTVIAELPKTGVTAADKLRLIADTVEGQQPFGTEVANFRRRLFAILSIGHDA